MSNLRKLIIKNSLFLNFLIVNIFAISIPKYSFAQVTPDTSLPKNSVVNGNQFFTITGGTSANTNLFHSFSQFSLTNGETAFFDNPLTIQNILVRITANSASNIDGVIRANGSANLFLINPNGIDFGENASLEIGGSFLATTANSVRFLDGSEFRANANTQTTLPLLLVSAPVGLQFNGLTNGAIALSESPFLIVPIDKTLALVGGDVNLQGAYLGAESGRIEIGSVAGNGFVAIAQNTNDLSLNYVQAPNLGNIRLVQSTTVDTRGIDGGGSIQIQGRQVVLDDGSSLLSFGNGAEIFVRATELLAARGTSSVIFVDAGSNSSGNVSNIRIETKRIEFSNGGGVAAFTSGSDNGANIIITTDDLLIDEFGGVIASTFGTGNTGNVDITAKNFNLISNDNGGISAATIGTVVFQSATGNGGNLTITTDNLQLTGGSQLTAITFGLGNSGNIDITAKSIVLNGDNPPFSGGITTGVQEGGTGNGGILKITSDNLSINSGAQVVSGTKGSGAAGNILIDANLIDISGKTDSLRSGLFSSSIIDTGKGGDIVVNSDRLIVRDGGIIAASNFSSNNTAPSGSGSVGNITINSPSILLNNGLINIDSATDSLGNIKLNSNLLLLRNSSKISTNALGNAIGGNIVINTDFLVAVPTENSDITANSVNNFGGRNIITAKGALGFQTVNFLTPLSDITATSSLGTQFNGLVEIRSPDNDLSRGLVKLPDNLTDGSKQIVTACDRIRGNEFIVTGRGGVPSDATKVISSQAIWSDLRLTEIPLNSSSPASQGETSIALHDTPSIPQIEAQGWGKDRNGNLQLLAYANSSSVPVWRSPVICPTNPIK
ncbi:MAG: hypothetical protein DCE90_05280 [Pseudanabaena sp.]|nr:MAG: hypothetical protein DCE90_05280 [Pseudanabaena sp.]